MAEPKKLNLSSKYFDDVLKDDKKLTFWARKLGLVTRDCHTLPQMKTKMKKLQEEPLNWNLRTKEYLLGIAPEDIVLVSARECSTKNRYALALSQRPIAEQWRLAGVSKEATTEVNSKYSLTMESTCINSFSSDYSYAGNQR